MQVAVGLLLDRVDDRRVTMARVLAADAAAEVDERPAVRVGDARALGLGDDELLRGHPAGDVARALGEDTLRGCRVSWLHRGLSAWGGSGQLPEVRRDGVTYDVAPE